MESRKMVQINVFTGQQWRYREQSMNMGRGEGRARCMERVTWEIILPYAK